MTLLVAAALLVLRRVGNQTQVEEAQVIRVLVLAAPQSGKSKRCAENSD